LLDSLLQERIYITYDEEALKYIKDGWERNASTNYSEWCL